LSNVATNKYNLKVPDLASLLQYAKTDAEKQHLKTLFKLLPPEEASMNL